MLINYASNFKTPNTVYRIRYIHICTAGSRLEFRNLTPQLKSGNVFGKTNIVLANAWRSLQSETLFLLNSTTHCFSPPTYSLTLSLAAQPFHRVFTKPAGHQPCYIRPPKVCVIKLKPAYLTLSVALEWIWLDKSVGPRLRSSVACIHQARCPIDIGTQRLLLHLISSCANSKCPPWPFDVCNCQTNWSLFTRFASNGAKTEPETYLC